MLMCVISIRFCLVIVYLVGIRLSADCWFALNGGQTANADYAATIPHQALRSFRQCSLLPLL